MRMLAKLLLAALAALAVATALPATAATPINQTRPLDARGRVEIENLKGKIEVVAWDRQEVKLGGTLGDGVEKLSVEGDGRVLRIKVQYPARDRNTEPSHLVVQMPILADLEVETVSADISVSGMASRELELESVSGDIVANGAPRRGSVSSVSWLSKRWEPMGTLQRMRQFGIAVCSCTYSSGVISASRMSSSVRLSYFTRSSTSISAASVITSSVAERSFSRSQPVNASVSTQSATAIRTRGSIDF